MSAFETSIKIVAGDVAHDAADSGSPIKMGGKASTSRPTPVADGDRVNAWMGLDGRVVTSPGATGAEIHSLAARTGTPTFVLQTNPGSRGVYIIVYVTAVTSTPSVTPQLYLLTPTATATSDVPQKVIWQAATAIATTGTYVYLLYPSAMDYSHPAFPGITETQPITLPHKWVLGMNHGNANSITYQVVYQYAF